MDMRSILARLFARASHIGMSGTIQFVFLDDTPFWVDIGERVDIHAGESPQTDTQIEVRREDLLNIVSGRADVEQMFAAGRVKIRGNLGLATLLPRLIEDILSGGEHKPKAEMDRRYPAPARFSEVVSASQPTLLCIERRRTHDLSVNEFTTRYLSTGTPVIVSDALHDWPLFQMSRSEAVAHCFDLNGITRHGDYVSKAAFSTKRDFRTVPISDFIASLDDATGPADGPAAYMGNNVLPSKLLATIRFPPYFPRPLFTSPRLWIGPKGTLTPLHRDGADNLFAQVWGRKAFVLIAPHHREALGTWATTPEGGLEGCTFDPEAPDYDTHPGARDVPLLRFQIEAGELLFLPEGWFHRVASVATSMSVNFWINSSRTRAPGAKQKAAANRLNAGTSSD